MISNTEKSVWLLSSQSTFLLSLANFGCFNKFLVAIDSTSIFFIPIKFGLFYENLFGTTSILVEGQQPKCIIYYVLLCIIVPLSTVYLMMHFI